MSMPMIKQEIRKRAADKYVQATWRHLLCFFCSFFTARSNLLEEYTPLGLAFTAAIPGEYSFSAAAGALLGYLIPLAGISNIRYMGAVGLTALAIWLLGSHFSPQTQATFRSVCAGSSLTGVFLVLALTGETEWSIATMAGEVFLATGCAYFFSCFFEGLYTGKRLVTTHQIASAAISVTLLLTAFMPVTLWDISPARIAGILVILYAARFGKESTGSVTGIAAGFAVFLHDPDLIPVAVGFALGGLVAGMFAPTGKFGVGIGFILSNGLIAICCYHSTLLPVLYEVALATLAFLLLPTRVNQMFAKRFGSSACDANAQALRDSLVLRLDSASHAVQDVSKTVEEVSLKLKKLSAPTFDRVFEQTEQDACASCGLRIYCWESNRGGTLSALLQVTKQLRKKGSAGPQDLPEEFFRHCVHPDRLLDALAQNFADYLAKDAAERRLEEVRQVIVEQFEGVSQMLSSLSEEYKHSHHYDSASAQEMENALITLGLTPNHISCRIDPFDRMTAEISLELTEGKGINRSGLMRALSQKCSRQFEPPVVIHSGHQTLLTLTEKAVFSVDFGAAQHHYHQNKLCGDAFQGFFDGRGRFVMVLSDGMGKGGRAAVDGAMASGLMGRLIQAGFDADSALKVVNSAMLYKSTDESLATLDLSIIDLFSGRVDFFKAGAPLTLLRKNGKAGKVEGETLPAGILQGIGFDRSHTIMTKGDIIVMVSDGALSDGTDWIGVEMETWKYSGAQALADHLADYARRRQPEGKEDDITVLVAIIEKWS